MFELFVGDYVKISLKNSNIIDDGNFHIYAHQSTVFVIEKVGDTESISINGYNYMFYGEKSIDVDMTDLIYAGSETSFSFVSETDTFDFEFTILNGIAPKENEYPPNRIPFTGSTMHLSIACFNSNVVLESFDGEDWNFVSEGDFIMSALFNTAQKLRLRNQTSGDIYPINFISVDCLRSWVLVKWKSYFGTDKHWWFEVESDELASDSNISILTNTDDYSVRKNKLKNMNIIHRKADEYTRRYLSDIVFSDNVKIKDVTGSDVGVFITNNSFVNAKGVQMEDVKLNLKVNHYDTV